MSTQHDARCISLTDSTLNFLCDCATLRLIDASQSIPEEEFSLTYPPLDPLPNDTRMVIRGAYDSEVIRVGSTRIETPIFDRLASRVFGSRERDEW